MGLKILLSLNRLTGYLLGYFEPNQALEIQLQLNFGLIMLKADTSIQKLFTKEFLYYGQK